MAFPPSEKEKREYYYGLPSQPVLVARSNPDDEWYSEDVGGNWPESARKRLSNVGQHKIVNMWDGPLREQILEAIQPLEWNSVDVLRIDYEQDETVPDEQVGGNFARKHPEPPVTLFVTVQPSTPSATWGHAYSIAMRCKEILENFDINDVHCEIKEGQVYQKARLTPVDFDPSSEDAMFKKQFSENISASIAPRHAPREEGMKGLYLRFRMPDEPDQTVLLTSRHVALPSLEVDEAIWVAEDASDRPSYPIIQPSNTTVEKYTRYLLEKRKRYWQQRTTLNPRPSRDDRMSADEWRAVKANWDAISVKLKDTQRDIEKLEELSDPDTRIIGHVVISPYLSFRPKHDQDCSKADYALIRLSQAKHQTALNSLENRLHVGNKSHEDAASLFKNTGLQVPRGIGKSSLLKGKIPEAELFRERSRPLLVGKCGNGSNLTFGYSNEVKSLRRYGDYYPGLYGEEWCVIGIGGSFAKEGDSGAVVWEAGDETEHRRVGGLITSGSGSNKTESDVTYVTPLERLINDIKEYGHRVSLIGEE